MNSNEAIREVIACMQDFCEHYSQDEAFSNLSENLGSITVDTAEGMADLSPAEVATYDPTSRFALPDPRTGTPKTAFVQDNPEPHSLAPTFEFATHVTELRRRVRAVPESNNPQYTRLNILAVIDEWERSVDSTRSVAPPSQPEQTVLHVLIDRIKRVKVEAQSTFNEGEYEYYREAEHMLNLINGLLEDLP